jgi:hypothetical protein
MGFLPMPAIAALDLLTSARDWLKRLTPKPAMADILGISRLSRFFGP